MTTNEGTDTQELRDDFYQGRVVRVVRTVE